MLKRCIYWSEFWFVLHYVFLQVVVIGFDIHKSFLMINWGKKLDLCYSELLFRILLENKTLFFLKKMKSFFIIILFWDSFPSSFDSDFRSLPGENGHEFSIWEPTQRIGWWNCKLGALPENRVMKFQMGSLSGEQGDETKVRSLSGE